MKCKDCNSVKTIHVQLIAEFSTWAREQKKNPCSLLWKVNNNSKLWHEEGKDLPLFLAPNLWVLMNPQTQIVQAELLIYKGKYETKQPIHMTEWSSMNQNERLCENTAPKVWRLRGVIFNIQTDELPRVAQMQWNEIIGRSWKVQVFKRATKRRFLWYVQWYSECIDFHLSL